MTELQIQQLLENQPYLDKYNLGKCIKSEFTQQNGKRLDSLFESKKKRFVVEYQLNSLDLDHITRGIIYFNSEKKNNPEFEHSLFFISTKYPKLAELEFLEFNSSLINIKTFIFNEKTKTFEEYCFKEYHIKKQKEISVKKNEICKTVKKIKQYTYFENLNSYDNLLNIINEYKYQDFFYKKEFDILISLLNKNLFISINKRVKDAPFIENLKDIIFDENFNFNELKEDEFIDIYFDYQNKYQFENFKSYMEQKYSSLNRFYNHSIINKKENYLRYFINFNDKIIK